MFWSFGRRTTIINTSLLVRAVSSSLGWRRLPGDRPQPAPVGSDRAPVPPRGQPVLAIVLAPAGCDALLLLLRRSAACVVLRTRVDSRLVTVGVRPPNGGEPPPVGGPIEAQSGGDESKTLSVVRLRDVASHLVIVLVIDYRGYNLIHQRPLLRLPPHRHRSRLCPESVPFLWTDTDSEMSALTQHSLGLVGYGQTQSETSTGLQRPMSVMTSGTAGRFKDIC